MKKVISTPNAPAAVGPYSQATFLNGILYISCQLGINPETGKIEHNDIVEQTNQIMKNVQNILNEVNMTLANVMKTTVILKDINQFSDFNNTYKNYFKEEAPARTCFSANLPLNALVGIDFIASK